MVYDVANMALRSISAAYNPFKDLIIILKNKKKYITELEDNLLKLTAEMSTFYSRKQDIDRLLETNVSKETNDEYNILVKQFQVFKEKYNKITERYNEHSQTLLSVPAVQEVSTQGHDPYESTLNSVIEAVQTRKSSMLTLKLLSRAKLSKDICKLYDRVSRITERMKIENVIIEKKVKSVQVRHVDIDIPSFSIYVQDLLTFLSGTETRVIGVLGPIGVGKTSVMRMLNNQLKDYSSVVIWINFPEQLNEENKIIEVMQDAIMGRLKLNKEKGNNVEQNADIISTALTDKKYILLIDQVSLAFDFDRLGIRKEHSKVVVASSNMKVIDLMTDSWVDIRPLLPEDSRDLFDKVCGVNYDSRIKDIAESIVASCGGIHRSSN